MRYVGSVSTLEEIKAYDDTNVMQLAEEVGKSGREKLKDGRKNPSR